MALPIRNTPVLHGKDALVFDKKAREALLNPVSDEELDRIKKAFDNIKNPEVLLG
jgi:hypothetical protein